MHRFLLLCCLLGALAICAHAQQASVPAQLSLPPSVSAAGTGVVVDNTSWGYVVWQATNPAWHDKYDLAVWLKTGDATSTAAFALQGTMAPLNDAAAIDPWIKRSDKLATATGGLAENLTISADNARRLIEQWSPTSSPFVPTAFKDRLAILGNRARQEPGAAAALRALGQSHPVYRFLTGTGWAGPLGVPVGQDATIELREVLRSTGVEGAVIARVTLRAVASANNKVSPDLLTAPGSVVQVLPAWPGILPGVETTFSITQTDLPDLAPALRWSIPDALRRQILLTRGFMIWRGGSGSFATISDLLASEGSLKKILRNPAAASVVFKGLDGVGTGPQVDDFPTDRKTWFVSDDNGRFNFNIAPPAGEPPVFTGVAHLPNTAYNYHIAATDLLGRYGPPAPARSAVALQTLPPVVPKIMRVENVVSSGNQRLRVTFQTNKNLPGAVPTTRYLIFRDRLKNTEPASNSLDSSINPTRNDEMVYVGQVLQPANPTATPELSLIDESLAPTLPAHYGQTYYYCVRAANQLPQGYNISPPSPPAFGTVRDREGPPAPTGFIVTETPRAGITFAASPAPISAPQVLEKSFVLRLQIERLDPGVTYFKASITSTLPGEGRGGASIERTLPDLHFGNADSFTFDYPVGLNIPASNFLVLKLTPVTTAGREGQPTAASILLSAFTERTIATLAIQAKSGLLMEMDPINDAFWNLYFLRLDGTPIGQSFTPVSSSDGTFTATFPGAINFVRARSLLIQRRAGGIGEWRNVATARLPQSSSQFVFRTEGPPSIFTLTYRVWEVFDNPNEVLPPYPNHQIRTGNGSVLSPIRVGLILPIGTHEYRLYRRIDDGPLFLLKQDTGTWDQATVKTTVFNDGLLPPAGGVISYFGQTFDQNGNPGPLALLDQKIGQYPELPIPVVDALESAGTTAAPTMSVRASCASPGVERIEILVTPAPETTPNLVVVNKPAGKLFNFKPGDLPTAPQDFAATVASSALFAQDPNIPIVYQQEIKIKAGVEYSFQLRALGRFDTEGSWSSVQKFTWTAPLVGSAVPWPARPLPARLIWANGVTAFVPVSPAAYRIPYSTGFKVIKDGTTSARPVAVQIGTIPLKSAEPASNDAASNWDIKATFSTGTSSIPSQLLTGFLTLRNLPDYNVGSGPDNLFEQFVAKKEIFQGDISTFDFTRKLLPVVLYRQQTHRRIAGVLTPLVAADLVQVSPMIRAISWLPEGEFATLMDPYVGVAVRGTFNPDNPSLALCLYDTAPLASGARYRYFLAHFDEAFEIDGVIDAGVVEMPLNP